MVELPQDIKLEYDKSLSNFENYSTKFHRKLKKVRKIILTKKFEPVLNDATTNQVSSFILQFYPYLDFLPFLNDGEVIDKLKKVGFASNTLKWLVSVVDIEKEIKRLIHVDGLLILPYAYLFASIEHIKLKFKIEIVESFGLNKIYNKSDTNTLFIDTSNRLRRRAYQANKNHKIDNSNFEEIMQKVLDEGEDAFVSLGYEKEEYGKVILKGLKGNSKHFLSLFLNFYNGNISKNQVFLEIFPLLKLILKDVDLLNEDEYNNSYKNQFYDRNYRFYKISRVKKILLQK